MPDVTGFFDSFLEAAVSLAVLFVIVAWVSSKIVELGQLTFNVHGKILRDELERCFGEESGPNKGRFTRYFYWHPMIVPLTQPSALVSFWRTIRGWFERIGWIGSGSPETHFPPGRLPGHIAPETFAAVVMNPFPWPTTEAALRRLLIANLEPASSPDPDADPPPAPPLDTISDEVIRKLIRGAQTSIPGLKWDDLVADLEVGQMPPLNSDFLGSQVDIHGPAPSGTRRDPVERYVEMCRSNELVPHPLETRIITLLRDADNDLDEFRGGLRRWYAEAMARVTGRFKRTALVYVFFVALIICTLFNLNAINLFSALMASPELRAAGVAAAQVVGTKPGGVEALAQKVEFTEAYRSCVDEAAEPEAPKPDLELLGAACQARLLKALWRDSRRLNLVETFVSEQPPSSLEQIKKVRGLCEDEAGLCATPFKAKLDACRAPRPAEPAARAAASALTTAPEPGPAPKGEQTSDRCSEAWDAIWSGSGFFWHPGAARQLAVSLAEESPGDETRKLRPLLYPVRMQAAAETGAVEKFLTNLPDLGPVWNDKKFKGWNILWILFGVMLSALLAALGAPFWYDVLGKLTRRGTSGARGEKT